ncbi:diacylglycerol/lipid kinase family protein [Brachybacterium hainanense]|uniref:Diacylglycerol/lipid kinase family protein n=1 Tax=Brachybacterium hainanense TaxID=1541174 RepID=A0ABV6RBY8_9MICO
MSRLRVGLLSNPTAAHGAGHRTGRQVANLLRLAGLSVVDVSGPSAAVARARAEEVIDTLTALVVVGGDGTISLGASLVAHTPVRLGVVAAGSGNDLARSLGLPVGAPEESVRLLLHALSRPATAIDAIEIRGHRNVPPHRSIALGNVSLGFDALVNERANSARSGVGAKYSVALLRELPSFSPLPYWVEVDGQERYEVDATLLTVANTGVFGGGLRFVPGAVVDDGLLDLATVAGARRRDLLAMLPRLRRGTHVSHPAFSVRRVREVTVGLRHGRDVRAYADGEPRALLPVTMRVAPGAVRILADLDTIREERA